MDYENSYESSLMSNVRILVEKKKSINRILRFDVDKANLNNNMTEDFSQKALVWRL